eukprot:93809_1
MEQEMTVLEPHQNMSSDQGSLDTPAPLHFDRINENIKEQRRRKHAFIPPLCMNRKRYALAVNKTCTKITEYRLVRKESNVNNTFVCPFCTTQAVAATQRNPHKRLRTPDNLGN